MSIATVLLRQRIRRDRRTTTIWVLSTGFLALVAAVGVAGEYGSDEDRFGIMKLAVANPAILVLRGLPQGTDLDQFVFFQIFTYLALLAGLMTTFLVVRHTRAEEETGRAELISSTPASRVSPTLATITHGVLANLVLGLVVALGFIAARLDPVGSLVTGLATAATGVAFLGVALLIAQFMRSSRGANGASVAAVLLAFVLRGIGDAAGTPGSDGVHVTSAWPSWLSPIGWGQHVDAFGSNDLTPLLLSLGLAVVTSAVALFVQSRRDLGASLLAGTRGRANASAALSSSFGLAWRLQRSTIIGWMAGGAATGLIAGALSPLLRNAAEASPAIDETISSMSNGDTSLDQSFILVIFGLVGILAAACAIQAVIRLRQEESAGTAELVLAAPVSRVRWFVDYLVVGVIAILAVLASAVVFAILGIAGTGGDESLVSDTLLAAAAQIPAALVFLGLVALVFTVLPAATIGIGWGLLGLLGFLGSFGPLLKLPESLTSLSPFANTPVPFGDDADWSGGLWMLLVAAALLAASVILMRNRPLHTT